MIEARSGLVIRYAYLRAREQDRGEEAGRKDRPASIQILIAAKSGPTTALLFPITRQPPHPDVAALSIPETEAKRVGLRTPAWIIVNEWNEDQIETSPYVVDARPLGEFSKMFVLRIREAAIAAIKQRRYRSVSRK
ncbi:hypothetical protein [Terrarubrum flagellatum]|uniref:hypothetical protein n=1 Tax=Terrirubrum flagellatum TaxID=2895980 RepID=UPI003144DE85